MLTKGLVVYDSVFGNTKLVAEAIAQEIAAAGHQADLRYLREDVPRAAGADFLFIGSPTRMGKMTRATKRFVKRLGKETWGDRPIVIFDTYGPVPKTAEELAKARKWLEPGAAGRLADLARANGLAVRTPALRCEVTGLKGPLGPAELDKARTYTREFLASLSR